MELRKRQPDRKDLVVHTGALMSIAVSGDRKRAIYGYRDVAVTIWNRKEEYGLVRH